MDKRRPLTSDELGAKGESRFPELCLDARLKPAKPDRDRTGWDFIVTWPLAAGILDTRPAPLVAQVQLKTIWADNDTVSFNLGTLYNIVSDARPAFIVVLAVDDPTLAFARLHLLHITGDFLAEILKRLRKAQSDGKEAGDVQFQARVSKWGVALTSVCGAALRTAIEAAVPDGMAAYGTAKQTLLQTLGYEKGRLRLTTTIEANTHDDIVEGFLGVRPLRLVEAERFDTRFDIPISLGKWDTTAATIELKPTRFDRGVVTIMRTRDGQLLHFHGDIFTAPSAVAGPDRVVLDFRNALIQIRVDLCGAGAGTTAAINLITADDPDSIATTAAVWRDFFTLLAWMASERLSFELRTAKKKVSPIMGSAEPRLNPEQARRMDYYARCADIVDWVMARAEAPGTRMRPAAMIEAADDLDVIKAIEQTPDEVSALGFTTTYVDTLPEVFEYDMLYLNRIAIDNFEIAIAARTKMKSQRTGESMAWTSGPLQLVYVRKIKPNADAFGHFAGKARRTSGIVNWVAPAEAQFGVLLPSPAIDVPARRISGETREDASS